MSNSEEALSALYHALRAPRRRAVIHFLQQDDDEVITTRELARKIASREQGLTDQQATGEPYRNVYNALSQTHLPTLARWHHHLRPTAPDGPSRKTVRACGAPS